MSCWWNEVQKSVNTIVPKTWIALDTRLFRQDIVILALKMTNNLLETVKTQQSAQMTVEETYANSLSMLSPKPGVSTIVKAMRTPSSSSSVGRA